MKSVHHLVRILTAANEEKDKDLLRNLFFVTKPGAEGDSGGDTGKGGKRKKPKEPPPGEPKAPPPIRIDRVATGFRVYGNPGAPPKNRLVTVTAAYAVRNGNPFKRYLPQDVFNAAMRTNPPPPKGVRLVAPSYELNWLQVGQIAVTRAYRWLSQNALG